MRSFDSLTLALTLKTDSGMDCVSAGEKFEYSQLFSYF